MKKIIYALCAGVLLLCLSTAQAESPTRTLADLRAETADGWHQTYEAHGRTITVDIPVQVPETDAIAALVAEPLPLRGGIPDTTGKADGCDVEDHFFCNERGFFRVDTPSQAELRSFIRSRKQQDPPRGYDTPPVIIRFNELDWDTAYSYKLSATLRDADMLMKNTLETYFADETILLTPHWVHARNGCRRYDEKAGAFSGDCWEETRVPLIAYFDQVLDGIPVLTSAAEAFNRYVDTKVEEQGSIHFGGIAILQDEGMSELYTSAQFNNMLKVNSVLSENVPLCGFATVLASCEQLITEGRLRSVSSLRLGYVAWYGKNGSYTLIPTWVLEGELFENATSEYQTRVTEATPTSLEFGALLFDAQTGEFIDPWVTPKDRAYCSGVNDQ